MRSRTSKTVVALLVVIVVLLINGTRRQRKLIRLFTGFSFRYWGEDQVNGVLGFFGSVASDIKDLIGTALRALMDVVQPVLDFVYSGISAAYSLIASTLQIAKDFATGLMWTVLDFVNHAVQLARDAATWAIAVALNAARDFASWIVAAAVNALNAALDALHWVLQAAINVAVAGLQVLIAAVNDAWNAAVTALRWIMQAALDVAMAGVNAFLSAINAAWQAGVDALHWILQAAIDVATKAINATIDALHWVLQKAIDAAANELRSALGLLNDYVFGPVQTLISVVEDVIDWLIGLALFPFTTARDMWEAMRSSGGASVLDRSPDFVDRWHDHVLGHAVAYVGARSQAYTLPPLPHPPSGGAGGAGRALSYDELVSYANGAGIVGQAANIAAAIALAESGGVTDAHNQIPPDDSYGPWQINMIGDLGPARRAALGIAFNTALYDPATNARAMAMISGGGTHWDDWSTFNNGAYRRFLR